MTITRNDAEEMLVYRTGPLLTAAGMSLSYQSINGNDDLNGPIGRAIRYLGYTVIDITSVADSDVAQVTDAQYDEFLDVADLFTLEVILGNLDDVDLTVGPRSEKFSQLAAQVERKLKWAVKRCSNLYDYGLKEPEAGLLTVQFAEHG